MLASSLASNSRRRAKQALELLATRADQALDIGQADGSDSETACEIDHIILLPGAA